MTLSTFPERKLACLLIVNVLMAGCGEPDPMSPAAISDEADSAQLTADSGQNVILLDPDVARAFPDSKSVNKALRKYLEQRSGS